MRTISFNSIFELRDDFLHRIYRHRIGEHAIEIIADYTYGKKYEFVLDDKFVSNYKYHVRPAKKPVYLFRGQTNTYNVLYPNIYRKYGYIHKYAHVPKVLLQSTIEDNLALEMPNPYYNIELERDLRFSMIKQFEFKEYFLNILPHIPTNYNFHALSQHYGFDTNLLDFTENIDVAMFFATQVFDKAEKIWKPCEKGIGVIYVLNIEEIDFVNFAIYEIGIQPLKRPEIQFGWSLSVPPGKEPLKQLNLLELFFKQNQADNQFINEKFDGGRLVCPEDPFESFICDNKKNKYVKLNCINKYVDFLKKTGTDNTIDESYLLKLFENHIEIR